MLHQQPDADLPTDLLSQSIRNAAEQAPPRVRAWLLALLRGDRGTPADVEVGKDAQASGQEARDSQ